MHYQAGEFNGNLISIISGIENVSVIIVTHSYIPFPASYDRCVLNGLMGALSTVELDSQSKRPNICCGDIYAIHVMIID